MNYYDPNLATIWFGKGTLADLDAEIAFGVAINDFLEGFHDADSDDGADPYAHVESRFPVTNTTLVDGTPIGDEPTVSDTEANEMEGNQGQPDGGAPSEASLYRVARLHDTRRGGRLAASSRHRGSLCASGQSSRAPRCWGS
jgi:hypothetical protein